jgi:NAD(P)-dependent dehydrogenase (short-subunit alcohol dehydrogenase family)
VNNSAAQLLSNAVFWNTKTMAFPFEVRVFGAFADITEESFHVHYNINVLGSILMVQEAIKGFGAEGGSVINLSSIVGSHPVA